MRPATKATVPYFTGDGGVHFRRGGELTTLRDADGRVRRLVELLDGTRTVPEITADLQSAYPDATGADVDGAVAALDGLTLLQDADAPTLGLSATQLERWDRNLGFFETYASLDTSKYELQRRLMDAKVAMLGVGGVGSHVLIDLVAMGVGDIRIVDFDTVQLSNLNRQILYGEQYLGQSKIDVARERTLAFNSELRLDTVQTQLGSADDVFKVVHDRDVVVAAVDRPKTTILGWLNEGCVRAGAPLLTGGVDTQRALHYTVVPGLSGCVECWQSGAEAEEATSRRVFDAVRAQAAEGRYFGEDRAAFNGLVTLQTAFLVGEVVRLATRVARPLSVGRALQVFFHDPQLQEAEGWTRRPDCPVCGSAPLRPELEWLAEPATLPF